MEKGNITAEGLDRTTIVGLVTSGLPILLPWSSSIAAVRPGTTFHSRLSATDDVWSKHNPFADLDKTRVVYTNSDGGQATYNSTKTTSSANNSEHLSVSLGVSVGCKFLNASVTGQYDKDVLENNDVGPPTRFLDHHIHAFARQTKPRSELPSAMATSCSKDPHLSTTKPRLR